MTSRVCLFLIWLAFSLNSMAIGFGSGLTLTLEAEEPTPAEPTYINEPLDIPAPVAEVQLHTAAEPETAQEPEATYTEEELEMLALVIYQEAGGDAASDSTRQMVGEVVLNRIADSRYPDTMYEVLTQRSQYGRLHWTGLVWPERASKQEEAHAVQRAYDTAESLLSGEAERLLPSDVVFQAEFKQGKEVVAFQDETYFCR